MSMKHKFNLYRMTKTVLCPLSLEEIELKINSLDCIISTHKFLLKQERQNHLLLHPFWDFGLYINSFIPIIEFKKSDEEHIVISFLLAKAIKTFLYFYCDMMLAIQAFILVNTIYTDKEMILLTFLPSFLLVGAYMISSICFRYNCKKTMDDIVQFLL